MTLIRDLRHSPQFKLFCIPNTTAHKTLSLLTVLPNKVSTKLRAHQDALPDKIIFFNGDHDGSGPSTDVIGFSETASMLTFSSASDAKFSDSGTKPETLSECTYLPNSGYDSNVKHICLNPKHAMASGGPDPNFIISFRARIK
jgi:hypothetical protein